jgi:hypothetical protein
MTTREVILLQQLEKLVKWWYSIGSASMTEHLAAPWEECAYKLAELVDDYREKYE